MNRICLTGNMVKDIELRYTKNNKGYVENTIAVSKDRKNEDGKYESDFITFVVFDKKAEYLNSYAKKGDKIEIEGKLRVDSWKDDKGEYHSRSYVVCDKINILTSRPKEPKIIDGVTPIVMEDDTNFELPFLENNMVGTPEEISRYLWQLDKDKQYEIKEYHKKRSLDSNAYCWVLCKEIADKLHITAEEVYRKNIKEMGKYEILPIKDEAVETFINAWSYKGIGWFSEILSKSKIEGYTNIIAYYGSSIYDSKEMSLLLDSLVQEAEQLNIETKTPNEIARLKELWKND